MFCLLQSKIDIRKFYANEGPKCKKEYEEQLKCSKEEVIVVRKRLSKLEEENKNLNREVDSYADTILKIRNSPLFKETYERD